MKIIDFSQEDLDKCQDFADNVDTSLYTRGNQFSKRKRQWDSMTGKLGELVVYYNLIDAYPELTYPDFKIYKSFQKSWDYDLKDPKFNLHVKTQDLKQSERYGTSWIFQKQDKSIFFESKENDYVAFVIVDNLKEQGEIKAILPVSFLNTHSLFKPPVLAKLFNKMAVYLEDLSSIGENLFQL